MSWSVQTLTPQVVSIFQLLSKSSFPEIVWGVNSYIIIWNDLKWFGVFDHGIL